MEFSFPFLVSIVVVYTHVVQFYEVPRCCSCMNGGLVVKYLDLGFRVRFHFVQNKLYVLCDY